jgi:hypothetical protein
MFDVVAMIPGVRRKPARLYCGGRTLQPFDLMMRLVVFCWAEPSSRPQKLIRARTGLTSPQPQSDLQVGVSGVKSPLVLVWADMAWLELP